jgi:putative ABC transport system substrate-binding protein
MNRRAFIAGLSSAAAWSVTAGAQQPAMPVIGLLSGGSPETFATFQAPLREGLAEAGFVEGKNLTFEYRWAQGHFERLPGLAIDLVGRGPAVIVRRPQEERGRKRCDVAPNSTASSGWSMEIRYYY